MPDKLTIEALVEAYLAHSKHFLSTATWEGRERRLCEFAARFPGKDVTTFRKSDLQLWLVERETWKSDWTRRTALACVQRCFNWAAEDDRIAKNPFTGVAHQEGEPRRPMTDQEFRALLRVTDAVFRRVLLFLRLTGCRPCEMAALTWEMLDRAAVAFVLKKHKTSKTQRVRKPRVIRLVPALLKLVDWLWRHRIPEHPHQRVFLNARGTPWNRCNLSLRMQRTRRRAGIDPSCKLYGTRHAFGSQAVVAGVDMKTLAVLMGHTSSTITERYYVHLEGEARHLAEAMVRATSRF